jgi:hypothetical protein
MNAGLLSCCPWAHLTKKLLPFDERGQVARGLRNPEEAFALRASCGWRLQTSVQADLNLTSSGLQVPAGNPVDRDQSADFACHEHRAIQVLGSLECGEIWRPVTTSPLTHRDTKQLKGPDRSRPSFAYARSTTGSLCLAPARCGQSREAQAQQCKAAGLRHCCYEIGGNKINPVPTVDQIGLHPINIYQSVPSR